MVDTRFEGLDPGRLGVDPQLRQAGLRLQLGCDLPVRVALLGKTPVEFLEVKEVLCRCQIGKRIYSRDLGCCPGGWVEVWVRALAVSTLRGRTPSVPFQDTGDRDRYDACRGGQRARR